MLPKLNFGHTGHASTRIIFGGYALSQATQVEADRVLGNPQVFLITAGDMALLPKILQAAERFTARPADAEMRQLVETYDIRPIFT